MGKVISFATGRPIPLGKTLIIAAEADRFSLRMSPALTEQERGCVNFYEEREDALGAAHHLNGLFPTLYRRVLDCTSAEAAL